MTDAPPSGPTAPRRIPWTRLAALVGVWIVLAGGAILVARALDDPVGAGDRDVAQPAVPGQVAGLDGSGDAPAPKPVLFLEEPLPVALVNLPPARQAARLRARVAAGGGALARVQLGVALQELGDRPGARGAFRAAARLAPGDLRPQVGLAMVEGAGPEPAASRGAAALARLAAANPGSQLVSFNQGVLAASRGRASEARDAWARTASLDARTRLGALATVLLRALAARDASGP